MLRRKHLLLAGLLFVGIAVLREAILSARRAEDARITLVRASAFSIVLWPTLWQCGKA